MIFSFRSSVFIGLLLPFLGCVPGETHGTKPAFGYPVMKTSKIIEYVEKGFFADKDRLIVTGPLGEAQLDEFDHYLSLYTTQNPSDQYATLIKGLIMQVRNRHTDAMLSLTSVEGAFGHQAYYHYYIGQCLLYSGHFEEAKTRFDRALGFEPHNSVFHLHLGYCYEKMNMLSEAKEHYLIASEFDDLLGEGRQRILVIERKLK